MFKGCLLGLLDSNNKELKEGDKVLFHPNGDSSLKKQEATVVYSKRRCAFMFKFDNISVAILNNIPTSIGITDPEPNFTIIE